MTPITFTLPLRLVNPLNNRRHWRTIAKIARTNRGATRLMTRAHLGGQNLWAPLLVTITRVSAGALDNDNLAASAKPCRDGIADALGIDDRDPRVTWAYAQRKGARSQYAVEVRIEQANLESGAI